MRAPELAIVVTTYQMPWHLRRALESIICQTTRRRLEVVVCDDGSSDETADVVAQFARTAPFPVQFVTHPHTEFHAARCRNDGARHSTAPHLLFFDGDCLLPPDHIEQHLALWRPGIVTCGYCVRLDQASSQQVTLESIRSGAFTRWATAAERGKLRAMHAKARFYSLIGHATKPSFRSGDFSIVRSDFERVNGFDEQFQGWGCEDDDFGRRLRAAGVKLLSVLHRTCVHHLWHPPATTRPQAWRHGGNVAYLQRPIRLTRCIRGQITRERRDLCVHLAGTAASSQALAELLAAHGWRLQGKADERAEIELLCRPGSGSFGESADCRVLAVLDESLATVDTRQAHIVLSPSGQIGRPRQTKLRLHDADALWHAMLGYEPTPAQRAAA